jgi:hypothetical protein
MCRIFFLSLSLSLSRYQYVITVIEVLEKMEHQARKDIERLVEAQQQALMDPVGFVRKILRKDALGLPRLQNIPDVPRLDLDGLLCFEFRSASAVPLDAHLPMTTRIRRDPTDGFYNVGLDFASPTRETDVSRIQVGYGGTPCLGKAWGGGALAARARLYVGSFLFFRDPPC